MKIVIDTNILVSALLKPMSKADLLISYVIAGKVMPCYDSRIMEEYREVLFREKFEFSIEQVNSILENFVNAGEYVIPSELPDIKLIDEDDRAFYEVAKFCNVLLITGNTRHFPEDSMIMTLSDFLEKYSSDLKQK